MDPRMSAQELMRCDLCETQSVQIHCDTCQIKLCNGCIGEHMASDPADLKTKHEIVKFKFRNLVPLFPFCASHDKERCEMHCNQCQAPVCISCIASRQHSGHTFIKILQIINERKEKIMKDQNELNNTIFPTYEEIESDVRNTIKQLEMEYKDLTAAITKHGVDFHKKIDQAVEKLHSKVEESKTNQLRILHAHLDDIKKKSSKIKGELNSINFVLDSQDFLKLSSFTFTIETFRKLPQKIMPFCATFTPRQIQGEELCTLFGLISSGKLTSEEHGYSFRDSSEAECISPVKQLLDKPKILTTLETKFEKFLNNVACVSEDEIWTSGNVCTMKRFNIIQSSLLEEVYLEDSCIPGDIAVTKHDYLVYTDPKERTVNIVKNEEKILIELENWKPCSICSTSSGDLLLTMDNEYSQSKVVRYSGFMVTQSIQFDDKGRHLYSSGDMKYVSENKNLDICVADSRAKAVVVVNKVGKLRFRYTGHHSFTPLGISTDSQSQILTADLNNHCVHIINQDGQFLRYIMCGLSYPWGLCTDKNDNLFVAQWRNRQVKKIKYLQ